MATQKRRVVYFSDEEWAAARKAADEQGLTISGLIRRINRQLTDVVMVSPPRTEAQRAIERVTDGSFNTRPFTPVPKPGQK